MQKCISSRLLTSLILSLAMGSVCAQNFAGNRLERMDRGEVDAGFADNTDTAIQKNTVRVISTVSGNVAITDPAAVIATNKNALLARQFIGDALSPAGPAVLEQYGFIKT